MERLARLRIKLILVASISLWLLNSCERQKPSEKIAGNIPAIFVHSSHRDLKQKEGSLYYKNQSFSGWQYELFANGDTAMIVPFYQGKEHGCARQWYPNRKLKEQRWYEAGEKTGEHLAWWENGNRRFIYHFENGVYEGNQQEWNEAGALYRNANYEKGKEKGLQQLWRYDGKLIANYVARNGRNFGLTGVKNCKSVWKYDKKN